MTFKKSSKEIIMGKLGTKIGAITGIAYYDYQRQYDQSIDKSKCPGCFINDVRIDKTTILKDITKNVFMVGFVGFVWAEDDENLGTVMNIFIEKIKDALVADRTLDGEIYTITIDVIGTDGGNQHPQGIFVLMTTITFFSAE